MNCKSRIFITGDTHGNLKHNGIPDYDCKLNKVVFPNYNNLTKNDYVIIVGDFGFIFENTPEEIEIIETKITSAPWTTLFVDGNHENFDALYSYPEVTFLGGRCHKIADSVYHLMRGEVFLINNKTFFVFGGARSFDKNYRIEGVSWWRGEESNFVEQRNGIGNLQKNNYMVDYVLTHSCPSSIHAELFPDDSFRNDSSATMNYLENIKSSLDFTHWYFGHFHENKQINSKFTCLYDDVIELGGLYEQKD